MNFPEYISAISDSILSAQFYVFCGLIGAIICFGIPYILFRRKG